MLPLPLVLRLITRLFILLLLATCSRLLFFAVNQTQFQEEVLLPAFLSGTRFDLSALVYFNSLFILISLVELFYSNTFFKKAGYFLFIVPNAIFHLFNLVDTGYIRFSGKRSGIDLFSLSGEWGSQMGTYFLDFWYLFIFFLLFLFVLIFSFRITEKIPSRISLNWKSLVYLVLFIGGLGVLARGSLGLLPLTIIDAARLSGPQLAPLTLNTPFTFIMSLQQRGLQPIRYFDDKSCELVYSPVHPIEKTSASNPNIVLIICESLGKEYVGFYNKGKGYTPFLDSLMNHSTVFIHAYSNGKRSIEGLPSILAGMPSLMNTDYASSYYQSNNLKGLGAYLSTMNYSTSFFHGGKNGTMSFDNIVALTKSGRYFGLNEYPDQSHFDGNWGIYDHHYLRYWCDFLNHEKQPFFSTVFTLSAHHPYSLPKGFENLKSVGSLPIHKTIRYTDLALQEFFEKAKRSSWYSNTVFIITADHPAENEQTYYQTPQGKFEIPLVIFNARNPLSRLESRTCSQVDIPGLALSLTQFSGKFFSFGSFPEDSFAVQFHDGYFQMESYPWVIQFNGDNLLGVYQIEQDPLMRKNLRSLPADQEKMFLKLKAFIQQYHQRLPANKTTP